MSKFADASDVKSEKGSEDSHRALQSRHTTNYRTYLYLSSILIRLILLLYSSYHDKNYDVKYTDVDYKVYTDAAALILAGKSPYERHTYRYPPLIALLMTLNKIIFNDFGKILFFISDILIGYLIEKSITNASDKKRLLLTASWLLNPFVLSISSRGSSDTLVCLLVIVTIYFITNGYITTSAFFFGLSVHVKIYPVIYLPSFVLYLYDDGSVIKSKFATFIHSLNIFRLPKALLWNINKKQVLFVLTSGLTLISFTAFSYWLYGFDFLYETYLYHYLRKDHRHNLSIYFNFIHHIVDNGTKLNPLLSFVPQFVCVLLFSLISVHNLTLSLFLQTLSFVSLNKVCTSQYFLWWIVLLPLVLSQAELNKKALKKLALSASIMLFFKALWLHCGYKLEFLGYNTFTRLLLSSVPFTLSQMYFGSTTLKLVAYQ